MIGALRKLLRRGSGRTATDGGTEVGQVSFGDQDEHAAAVRERYEVDGSQLDPGLPEEAVEHLGSLLDENAPSTSSYVPAYEAAGVDASDFVTAHEASVDAVVDAVFGRLREEGLSEQNLDRAEAELKAGLHEVVDDAAAGVAEFDVDDAEDEDELNVEDDELLDGIGMPVFMVDTEGDIVAWNNAMEELTQCSVSEAQEAGSACRAMYPENESKQSLASKVLEAPENADIAYDIERADAEYTLYQDSGAMVAHDDDEHEVEVSARPIFDDDELIAVVQTVNDRTMDVAREREIEELVSELRTTMTELQQGHLESRAAFDNPDAIDPQLVNVVDDLNSMADQFERLVGQVDGKTRELAASIQEAASEASDIADVVDEQNAMLSDAASEMQNFSASMQEVAASSDQVASAAEQAQAAAESGLDASEGASQATDEVIEISDDLVDSVSELESKMDEIEGVVEVIAEVADQTNLLALNANIEAARSADGDGFAVVADEVKELANETREHTERIAESIEEVQQQANETVVAVEESHEQIHRAGDEIDDALTALEEIAEAVDEAATGITEVARANDEQASTVEDVIVTIEEVQEQAEEASEASERIVAATQEQSEAVSELSARVDKLTNQDEFTSQDESIDQNEFTSQDESIDQNE